MTKLTKIITHGYFKHFLNIFRLSKENSNITFIENNVLDDTEDLVLEYIITEVKISVGDQENT